MIHYKDYMSRTLGIDFGGVLSIHDGPDTGKEHRSVAINMPYALEALRKLKSDGHKLVLVSFAGKSRSMETMASIEETCPDVFDSIYFVKDKAHKLAICRYEGCDVMIDDREDILESFIGSDVMPILYGNPSSMGIVTMKDWQEDVTKLFPPAIVEKTTRPAINLSKLTYISKTK